MKYHYRIISESLLISFYIFQYTCELYGLIHIWFNRVQETLLRCASIEHEELVYASLKPLVYTKLSQSFIAIIWIIAPYLSDAEYVAWLFSRWNSGGLINGAASWTWAISVGRLVKLSHNNSLNARSNNDGPIRCILLSI